MGEQAIPWIMLAATVITGWAAIANWLTAKATRGAMTASNLIDCLNAYTNVMRQKRTAINNGNEQQCKDFYRELFDLHWTEFQLWQQRMIPDNVMHAWLSVRRRNYDPTKGLLEFTTPSGEKKSITYNQIWNELKSIQYFEEDDQFVPFMDKAHTEKLKIQNMKKLRKEFIYGK